MKLWNVDVVFRVNGENLKERTLKKVNLLWFGSVKIANVHV